MLAEEPSVSVADISKMLSVSAVTVRNDLSSLEESGYIVRTRGGAQPVFHRSIRRRQRHRTAEKQRIARYAASLVEEGDTIMIEAGTTTALVAKYLLGKKDIRIVTNSTLILPFARTNPTIHLTVTGGEFRPQTESFVGAMALKDLDQFHVRLAFVGTDGFSLQHGLTTNLAESAEIVRKMANQALTTVLVADSSKYGKTGFAEVLPLAEIQKLITDSEIGNDQIVSILDVGVSVDAV